MRRVLAAIALVSLAIAPGLAGAAPRPVVRVGSKSFTESYVLAAIVARVVDAAGEAQADLSPGLGGTGITFRALERGAIDVYPEYTGTIAITILHDRAATGVAAIRARLARRGLTVSDPLGFDDTYALAVRRETSTRLGLTTISDLSHHGELRGAFSSGFLERDDGWPGLRRAYGLRLADVRVMEHALTYQALAQRAVDVIDVNSTDGQLARFDLVLLRDDRHFFPDYAAVLFARRAFVEEFPRTWAALENALVGRFDDRRMAALNALVDVDGKTPGEAAAAFLGDSATGPPAGRGLLRELGPLTLDHLVLVAVALGLAAVVGIPLGIVAARVRPLAQLELVAVGVVQTIPALALLCFMIPLFGIGTVPALVALFLYALLPIVRGAYTGLIAIDRQLLEVADSLALGAWQRLITVELPLASLSIMAGVKTSAIITVGTATLAAFIGAGGYGTLIVRGLAMNDTTTILAGAAPAAAMALAVHALFELLDRVAIPRGLRQRLAVGS